MLSEKNSKHQVTGTRRQNMTDIEDHFWGQDPSILFRLDRLREFFPTSDQSLAERMNSLTRLIIYITVAVAVYQNKGDAFHLGGLIVGLIFFMWNAQTISKGSEGFAATRPTPPRLLNDESATGLPHASSGLPRECVPPTRENPYMNRLLYDDPERPPACRGPGMQEMAANLLDQQLFNDVDDIYSRNANQRLFATMPSTTRVPERENFASWLVKPDSSCKTNRDKCAPPDDLRLQRHMIPEDIDNELQDVSGFSF
jgi:hypothetical protein